MRKTIYTYIYIFLLLLFFSHNFTTSFSNFKLGAQVFFPQVLNLKLVVLQVMLVAHCLSFLHSSALLCKESCKQRMKVQNPSWPQHE